MKYYHIITIFLLLFVLYWLLVLYRNKVILSKLKQRFKSYHKNLTDMLRLVVPIFEKYNIIYCLHGGSLLGYIRHNKSYIPWDDDIDIAIFKDKNFKNKLDKFKEELKQHDMSLNETPFGYNITQKGNIPYIDLFIYNFDKRKRRYMPNEWSIKRFPNEYFNHYEVFPMIKDLYNKVSVNIPIKYKKCVHKFYGKDCLSSYKMFNTHHASLLDKAIVYLTQRTAISL
jgi:hypothetical protein